MAFAKKDIPPAVYQRLPQYLAYVREQRRLNEELGQTDHIQSHEIARALGFTTSTVRQDFSHLSFEGSRAGYRVDEVDEVLTGILGVDRDKRMVIVGAGNLGRALARHGNFGKYRFLIKGIFDNDPELIGIRIDEFRVLDINSLPDFVKEEQIDIGVIAVPSPAAQEVADRLVLSGVRGLLNLAFTRVVAPQSVSVMDARIVSSLMLLSSAMDD